MRKSVQIFSHFGTVFLNFSQINLNLCDGDMWVKLNQLLNRSLQTIAKDIADALNRTEKEARRVVAHQIAEFTDKLKELDSHKASLLDLTLSQQIEKELFDQQIKRLNPHRDSLVEQLESSFFYWWGLGLRGLRASPSLS